MGAEDDVVWFKGQLLSKNVGTWALERVGLGNGSMGLGGVTLPLAPKVW